MCFRLKLYIRFILDIQKCVICTSVISKGGNMKSIAVSSVQQNQLNFKSRLVCDEGAKKILKKNCLNLAYQYRINHSSKPAPVFADLQKDLNK